MPIANPKLPVGPGAGSQVYKSIKVTGNDWKDETIEDYADVQLGSSGQKEKVELPSIGMKQVSEKTLRSERKPSSYGRRRNQGMQRNVGFKNEFSGNMMNRTF